MRSDWPNFAFGTNGARRPSVLASPLKPTITINNNSIINAMFSGRLPGRVGWYHRKCWYWLNIMIIRIYYGPTQSSNPSVLTTIKSYVFIFSLCCMLFVCNIFTTPRAGNQSRPLPLVVIYVMNWIRLQQNWMSRIQWSNIISNQHTSNIFCNHYPCLCNWHNTPSVKCHTQY